MKSTFKFFNSLFVALILIAAYTIAAASAGFDPTPVFCTLAALTVIATIAAAFNRSPNKPVLFATIFREVWTGEVIKKMNLVEMYAWVNAIRRDYSQYVSAVGSEAEVIHLASFPALPDVLIDNTSYPIATQDLATSDIPISLNKYQTKVTPITDDELFANTTSKMQNVAQAHTDSVIKNKFAKGAWNICPTGHTTATPVLVATGGNDGTGRKMLTWDDVLAYKRLLDRAEVDNTPGSRVIVLDTDHETDLCAVDRKFKEAFYDWSIGKPYNGLGFTFFGHNQNPYYNFTSKVKQSLGVTPTSAMRRASMFFSTERVGKAIGSTKVYLSPAASNPETQTATMNVRHYHLITRLLNEGVGAIVSPDA